MAARHPPSFPLNELAGGGASKGQRTEAAAPRRRGSRTGRNNMRNSGSRTRRNSADPGGGNIVDAGEEEGVRLSRGDCRRASAKNIRMQTPPSRKGARPPAVERSPRASPRSSCLPRAVGGREGFGRSERRGGSPSSPASGWVGRPWIRVSPAGSSGRPPSFLLHQQCGGSHAPRGGGRIRAGG
jgi:hypothetical protein